MTAEWLTGNVDWPALIWGGALTAFAFITATVVGVVLAGLILIRMPATYFCDHYCRDFWPDGHPFLRWAGRVLKNLLGAALVVLGGVLSLPGVPGPGILTILLGVTLLGFPGKRKLERWLIGRPVVLNAINRLRSRYGKPPVLLEPASMNYLKRVDDTHPTRKRLHEFQHSMQELQTERGGSGANTVAAGVRPGAIQPPRSGRNRDRR